jgi:hypothetical protein
MVFSGCLRHRPIQRTTSFLTPVTRKRQVNMRRLYDHNAVRG